MVKTPLSSLLSKKHKNPPFTASLQPYSNPTTWKILLIIYEEVAVYLIRTQQLSQSISMTLVFRSTGLPLLMIVQGFREQIDQLRASIPQCIKDYSRPQVAHTWLKLGS